MPWFSRPRHASGPHTRTAETLKRRWRPSVEVLEDRATPATPDPVYLATFGDAVTADNAITATDGQRYWTIDSGADSYQNDFYERPTAQTYQVRTLADGSQQFAAAEYFENLDLVEARAGFDADFLYVSVKLAGLDNLTADGQATFEGLAYRYGFRIAKQADGGGGLLVVADQPAFKNVPSTTFGGLGTFIYRDVNGDVGGTGLDVTKQDRKAEVRGNGYEGVVASDGKLASGKSVLWVRVSPTDPTVIEFALDYKAVGYTAEDLTNLAYFTAEANKGLKDPGNYLWNDEYTKSEAGSPYRASQGNLSKSEFGTQGLGNIYELDTIYLGPLEQPGTSSIAGTVYEDLNKNGQRDEGEPGIAGVQIFLNGFDAQGNAVNLSALTDSNGNYQFTELRAGTYELIEFQPEGYRDGDDTVGSVNGEPRGELVNNDWIGVIELGDNENGIGYDFGELFGIQT